MGRIKMYYLIVLTFNMVSVFCSAEDGHLCCKADQYVVRKNGISYCYEPEVNVTTSISLECANATFVIYKSQINHDINENGQLLLHFPNYETEHESGKYCLGTKRSLKNQSIQRPVAILCDDEPIRLIGEEPIGYCMIVSCLFLTLTATIYISLPELRDLQGMSIINLCVSLSLGLGILAGMKLVEYSDMTLCAIRGFLTYFFILTGFFWMNVISIQIMLKLITNAREKIAFKLSKEDLNTTFKIVYTERPSVSSFRWKEFQWYAAYAWGAPVVLTGLVAVVNFMPGDHAKPGIGLNSCWFFSPKQQWQYMYSVMSTLIVVNICIFVYTSVLLWKNTFNATQYKIVRYKFAMTIRLGIVMGVPWIFEMLGTVSSHVIWEVLDILNSLQGVLIFVVVVVLRRRTVQCMLRHGWLRCVEGPVERYLARGDNVEDEAEHTTLGVPLESVKE